MILIHENSWMNDSLCWQVVMFCFLFCVLVRCSVSCSVWWYLSDFCSMFSSIIKTFKCILLLLQILWNWSQLTTTTKATITPRGNEDIQGMSNHPTRLKEQFLDQDPPEIHLFLVQDLFMLTFPLKVLFLSWFDQFWRF